jgi:dienelactone hydrolase/catechol 2,3-dioxygenase-like lactoylglutathione lyase family enzyme
MTDPRPSFAGAAIEVRDLDASIAFHRQWLPVLGFRRVWVGPERVLWARGYDHFILRQARPDTELPQATHISLAFAADDRAQVDEVHRRLREVGADIVFAPQPFDYFSPGYYSLGFRGPDGLQIEVVHRWQDLPDIADAQKVQMAGADGIPMGGYLFRPLSGRPPHPALLMLHGFAGHAAMNVGLARDAVAAGFAVLSLSLRGWLGSQGESDQGLRQPDDVALAVDWLAQRPFVDPKRIALFGISLGGQVALLAAARRARVRAVAAYCPGTDLPGLYESNPYMRAYLDDLCGPDDVTHAGLLVRSPVHHADDIDVPVLLIHGDKDDNVPVEHSLRMAEALRRRGRSAEAYVVAGATHYFSEREHDIARQRLFAFLREHIGKR